MTKTKLKNLIDAAFEELEGRSYPTRKAYTDARRELSQELEKAIKSAVEAAK